MSTRNCDEPSPNDKNGPCPDGGGRRPCQCIDELGHVDDHGCRCGDTWPIRPPSAEMYLRLDSAEWALVSTYHDGSGVNGVWIIPGETAAQDAQAALLNAGIDLHRCTVLPVRRVVSQP